MTPRILNGPYLHHPNADMIVGWASIGRDVLIAGPAGIGKSMLLEHVAEQLKSKFITCLVQLSRKENMRRITPLIMLQHVADALVQEPEAAAAVAQANFSQPPDKLIAQVIQALAGRRVIVVIDGLDMLYNHPDALDFFGALGDLPEEITFVTAVPWKCVLGPRTEPLIRFGERFVSLRTIDVDFLWLLLKSRVANTNWIPKDCFQLAAYSCGGLPRMFLQIIQDAINYARLRRGDKSPVQGENALSYDRMKRCVVVPIDMTDVEDAIHDQEDSWQRCLLPGDVAQLIQHDGSDGLELDLPTKIRFLSHGMLLEVEGEKGHPPVLQVHPLLRSFCPY